MCKKTINKKASKSEDKQASKNYFSTINQSQPALIRSVALKQRAAQFGFDWHEWQPVAQKVQEELQEVIEAIELNQGHQRVEEEIGDLLMSVANLANQLSIEPESALHKANHKFEKRVNRVREILEIKDNATENHPDDILDQAWQQAKLEGL